MYVDATDLLDIEGAELVRGMLLLCVDGGHRTKGHEQANVPLTCQILQIDSLEEARQLFLIHNTGMQQVRTVDVLAASRTQVALSVKGLMQDYDGPFDVGRSQVHALIRGVFRYVPRAYVDPDIRIGDADVKRAAAILEVLTCHPWWRSYDTKASVKFPSLRSRVASSPSFLEALGRVGGTIPLDECSAMVRAVMASPNRFDENGSFGANLKKKSALELAMNKAYNRYRANGK